jgi:hypothetical protein
LGLASLSEGRESRVDNLECLVEEIGDGLVGVRESSIEEVLLISPISHSLRRSSRGETHLVEVLATPLGSVFPSMSTNSSVHPLI